jgi:hypothetical protein
MAGECRTHVWLDTRSACLEKDHDERAGYSPHNSIRTCRLPPYISADARSCPGDVGCEHDHRHALRGERSVGPPHPAAALLDGRRAGRVTGRETVGDRARGSNQVRVEATAVVRSWPLRSAQAD